MAHFAPSCFAEQAGEALQDKAWTPQMLDSCIRELLTLQKNYPLEDRDKLIGNEWVQYHNSGASVSIYKTPFDTAVVRVSSSSYGNLTSELTFQVSGDRQSEPTVKESLTKLGLLFMKAASEFIK